MGGGTSKIYNALGMAALMVIFWIFEVVPIYATALIPLFLATPLGLLNGSDLAQSYGNHNVYLFLGGFILALALEKWKVHHQIASRIIALFGSSKSRVLLGFGLSAYVLSMWISNTATTLMMLPMALSIIQLQDHENTSSRFPLLLMLNCGLCLEYWWNGNFSRFSTKYSDGRIFVCDLWNSNFIC